MDYVFPWWQDKRRNSSSNGPYGAVGTFINQNYSPFSIANRPNFGKGIYSCIASDADEYGVKDEFWQQVVQYTQADPSDPSVISQGGFKHFVEISFSGMSEDLASGVVLDRDSNDPPLQYGNTNDYSAFNLSENDTAQADYAQNYSALNNELQKLISRLTVGSRFKVKGADQQDEIFTIKGVAKQGRYNHTSWFEVWYYWFLYRSTADTRAADAAEEKFNLFGSPTNRRTTYILELDKDLSQITLDGDNILHTDNVGVSKPLAFQFISKRTVGDGGNEQVVSENPAIWETEPKETVDLDIYHEASEALPVAINEKNNTRFVPLGSVVSCPDKPGVMSSNLTYVIAWDNKKITLSQPIDLSRYTDSNKLVFTRPNDSNTTLRIDVAATNADTTLPNNTYIIKHEVSRNPFALSWYNSFSFGNGVESNRIRDDFNQPIIDKGAKVSTVLEENYEKERRSSGLIYSGIYNTNSGVNNLNQFIQAEKITKDLNPTYGSIQKLFSRNTDLVTFCEDRIIKILSNKDAVFNADGNANLTATNRVLGQAMPFAGDYGISKNPESFAVDNYRAYFTDKQRGAVLRLSMDGITPISEYGMSDYFKDNLKLNGALIGSFDIKKSEYNLTMPNIQKTVSFKESVNGWSSFKSFVPKQGVSMSGDYYTVKNSLPYKHHVESYKNETVNRNTFYDEYVSSSVSVLLNDMPSVVKLYKTLNYEGSQSNVNKDVTGAETGYYNLENKDGWKSKIKTDKQDGVVSEFVEKEGKWFNFIKGNNFEELVDLKTKEFSFQGVGRPTEFEIDYDIDRPIVGCTNPSAVNYNPDATISDNDQCEFEIIDYEEPIGGCMDPSADNYNPSATFDDGSCEIPCTPVLGCTNPNSLNFNPKATEDDGSCIAIVRGCTDSRASNYDPNANVDDGSCFISDPDPTTSYSLTIKDSNDNDGPTQNY